MAQTEVKTPMSAPPFLSLSMIVRDASSTIESLLDSVLKYKRGGTGPEEVAFDEIVLCDTGSVDDTREKIARAFGPDHFEPVLDASWTVPTVAWPEFEGGEPVAQAFLLTHKESKQVVRLVLARFAWIGDFSAARNYSFSLATARWRAWLDADDVLDQDASWRRTLQATEQRHPTVNAIEIKYDYAPTMKQDKCRITRWADGWVWTGRIHERPIRSRGVRIVSHWNVWVRHCPLDPDHSFKSLERNIELCEKSVVEARARGDLGELGISTFSLGTYAQHIGESETAARYLNEAISALPYSNIAAMAAVALSQVYAAEKDYGAATEAAGLAIAHGPEFPEAWGALAIATKGRGELERAADLFDKCRAIPDPPIHTSRDLSYLKGQILVHAALAYAAVGRSDDALAVLEQVPPEIRCDPVVAPLAQEATRQAMKGAGLEALRNMMDYYLWDCEPKKALALIEAAPAAISDSPEVARLRRKLLKKMTHLTDGWEGYKKAYADVPEHIMMGKPERKGAVLDTARAQHVIEWAKNLPKDGEALWALSIGSHAGLIERTCLEACTRLHFYVCDVAPQTGPDLQKLMEDFSDRVKVHPVRTGHYDWPVGPFGAIMLFEVIEHLPDEDRALRKLRARLSKGGVLFLSTPVADRWVEPYLTGPLGPTFHEHVRANNPTSMWRAIRANGLDGTLWATGNGAAFLAELREAMAYLDVEDTGEQLCHAARTSYGYLGVPLRKRIAIYAPWTPHPYDFDAHLRGHLGGSEEAVVHVSKALVERGYDVTVYCPRPEREDGRIAHAHAGVLWRETNEFDPSSEEYAAVLFWRCPLKLLEPEVRAAPYRRLLWLHDAQYGCGREAYEAADRIIVLSDTHEQSIIERDLGGDKGKVKFARAANGIDLDLHRELREDEERRDPHKCIYASAPERGLDHILNVWPKVREAVPDATLDIYYAWDIFARSYLAWTKKLEAQIEALKDQGVVYHGGVDHKTLYEASRRAGCWVYPSGFLEIFCTSAVKFQAAGCWPVTTDVGAVKEVVIHGRMVEAPDWDDAWSVWRAAKADAAARGEASDQENFPGIEAIQNRPDIKQFEAEYLNLLVQELKTPPTFAVRRAMSGAARARYGWANAAKMFDEIIQEARCD